MPEFLLEFIIYLKQKQYCTTQTSYLLSCPICEHCPMMKRKCAWVNLFLMGYWCLDRWKMDYKKTLVRIFFKSFIVAWSKIKEGKRKPLLFIIATFIFWSKKIIDLFWFTILHLQMCSLKIEIEFIIVVECKVSWFQTLKKIMHFGLINIWIHHG